MGLPTIIQHDLHAHVTKKQTAVLTHCSDVTLSSSFHATHRHVLFR